MHIVSNKRRHLKVDHMINVNSVPSTRRYVSAAEHPDLLFEKAAHQCFPIGTRHILGQQLTIHAVLFQILAHKYGRVGSMRKYHNCSRLIRLGQFAFDRINQMLIPFGGAASQKLLRHM